MRYVSSWSLIYDQITLLIRFGEFKIPFHLVCELFVGGGEPTLNVVVWKATFGIAPITSTVLKSHGTHHSDSWLFFVFCSLTAFVWFLSEQSNSKDEGPNIHSIITPCQVDFHFDLRARPQWVGCDGRCITSASSSALLEQRVCC